MISTKWWNGAMLWALLLAIATAGCAGSPVRTVDSPDSALMYGYFDLSEYSAPLDRVILTQDERAGIAYRQSAMTTYDDGVFFMENLPPMDYVVPHFTAGGQLFSLAPTEKDRISVPAWGMLYLGAYKYVPLDTGGVFSPDEFDLVPVDSPSEAEVLALMAGRVKHPRWKSRIAQRLEALDP